MQSETKVSNGYQVVVPSIIRKEHEIKPGDIIVWEKKGDKITIRIRKRKTFKDIIGLVDVKVEDAVTLKKKVQRGLI